MNPAASLPEMQSTGACTQLCQENPHWEVCRPNTRGWGGELWMERDLKDITLFENGQDQDISSIILERNTRRKAITTKVRQEVLLRRGGDLEGLLRVQDLVGRRRKGRPRLLYPRD